MKPKVLVLLAIPLLIFGGFKLYIDHKTRDAVDRAIAAIQPFVRVSYKGVTSSLGGSVGITGVEIALPNFDDGIRIDALSIDAGDLLTLMDMFEMKNMNEVPQQLTFNVSGVHFAMTADYMLWVENMAMQSPELRVKIQDLGCADQTYFLPSHYRELGYHDIRADFSLGYERKTEESTLTVFFDGAVHDMSGFELSFDLDSSGMPLGGRVNPAQVRPKLKAADLRLMDYSLMNRLTDHCVASGEMTEPEVVDAHMQHFVDVMANYGVIPDSPILAAYRQYAETPGTFVLTARPGAPVDLTRLRFYNQADIPDLLNLQARAL